MPCVTSTSKYVLPNRAAIKHEVVLTGGAGDWSGIPSTSSDADVVVLEERGGGRAQQNPKQLPKLKPKPRRRRRQGGGGSRRVRRN